MRVSVIVSTYNSPEWLEKVIWGYSVQSHRDFELVIADDGSGSATRRMIDRMRDVTGMDIIHIWHEDCGFRKTAIMNKAIVGEHIRLLALFGRRLHCRPRIRSATRAILAARLHALGGNRASTHGSKSSDFAR